MLNMKALSLTIQKYGQLSLLLLFFRFMTLIFDTDLELETKEKVSLRVCMLDMRALSFTIQFFAD